MPVPPPISTIGVCPNRWSQAAPMTGTRLPTCSESAVGVEADIGRKRALLEPFGQAGGGVLEQATGRQSFEQFGHRRQWYPLESSLAIG